MGMGSGFQNSKLAAERISRVSIKQKNFSLAGFLPFWPERIDDKNTRIEKHLKSRKLYTSLVVNIKY